MPDEEEKEFVKNDYSPNLQPHQPDNLFDISLDVDLDSRS